MTCAADERKTMDERKTNPVTDGIQLYTVDFYRRRFFLHSACKMHSHKKHYCEPLLLTTVIMQATGIS